MRTSKASGLVRPVVVRNTATAPSQPTENVMWTVSRNLRNAGAQPGQLYPYAVEMAAQMVQMNQLPPYVPYIVMDEEIPKLECRSALPPVCNGKTVLIGFQ